MRKNQNHHRSTRAVAAQKDPYPSIDRPTAPLAGWALGRWQHPDTSSTRPTRLHHL